MKKIKLAELKSFSEAALIKAGVTEENAKIVTEVLTTTDTFGVMSHGTKNLYQYILKMNEGGIDAKAEPSIVCEGPAFAVMDGNAAIGMVSSYKAMQLAIKKAKETGIGYVGVRNSCHFGAAGFYANMAAAEGMVGLSMSNGDPVMTIPGGKGVAIGNNPFSFAAPYGDKSVFLDIALSSVAALKVVMAKEKGIQIPKDWLVDENGVPTDDPSGFPGKSVLQPMAAHKGYGFAVMVEVLASVITGAGLLNEITSWNLDLPSKNKVGHAFIAIDATKMMEKAEYDARMSQVVDSLHKTPRAQGVERIFLPGEMEWDKRAKALENGEIEITDVMAENYKNLAKLYDLQVEIIEG